MGNKNVISTYYIYTRIDESIYYHYYSEHPLPKSLNTTVGFCNQVVVIIFYRSVIWIDTSNDV